jgi:hypothetical protein
MEVDGIPEAFSVAEPARHLLDALDPRVDRFSHGVRGVLIAV